MILENFDKHTARATYICWAVQPSSPAAYKSSMAVHVSLPEGCSVPPSSSQQPASWSGAKRVADSSLASLPSNVKLVHIVRHAQGHHNQFQGPTHQAPHDALLTSAGEAQCAQLQQMTSELRPSLVVTSPLTRTVQTALLCFSPQAQEAGARFCALESIRETVNFMCDGRRPISAIALDFPSVDFSQCLDDQDELWANYEACNAHVDCPIMSATSVRLLWRHL